MTPTDKNILKAYDAIKDVEACLNRNARVGFYRQFAHLIAREDPEKLIEYIEKTKQLLPGWFNNGN